MGCADRNPAVTGLLIDACAGLVLLFGFGLLTEAVTRRSRPLSGCSLGSVENSLAYLFVPVLVERQLAMHSTNRPTGLVLNPLKWSTLTWLVFSLWLAMGVVANLAASEFRYESGARVEGVGWPLTHTQAWYPANSASPTRQETSYLIAIVDALVVAGVQFSIIGVAPHWPRRFSVRTLLLLTTLIATLFAIGRVVVVDEVLFPAALNATDAIAGCLYFLPLAVWLGGIVLRRLGVRRFPRLLLPVTVVSALIALAMLSVWEYIPGTLCRSDNGFPHGTGKREYYYDSGALMTEEWYRAGLITRITWYRPDGTRIATSVFDKETGGVGLYLRQDGSIKSQMRFRYSPSDKMYFADGVAIDYASDGSVEKSVEYRDGAPVEAQQAEVITDVPEP